MHCEYPNYVNFVHVESDKMLALFLGENPRNGIMSPKLKNYRLEAGRFEDFVSYGLKSFAHEEVT